MERKEALKEYEKLRKKYNLPRFNKLAEDFDVERIFERESTYLLREIRKAMVDKFYSYLNFFENLLNPNSPSLFIYNLLKSASKEDKKEIKEIHESLFPLHIRLIKLDTVYSEEEEAKFIKDYSKFWDSLKIKIFNLVSRINEKKDLTSAGRVEDYLS